ncbi:MAG: hypothetical protein WC905_00725 [Patescibacteria group bacterium]|jgi:hypothetical protein
MFKKVPEKAKNLRRQGYSYREISERLNIAKSTARLWTSKETISEIGKKRMNNLIVCSQIKARHILLDKQKKYQRELAKECSVLKNRHRYSKDDLKLFLSLIYWAEGAKTERRLGFTNSDPEMIKVYLKLLRSSFPIKEEKISAVLHLHDYHNRQEMIDFWSKVAGIDKKRIGIYNKKHSGLRKKEGYKGCISIRYCDYHIFDEVMLVIKRFIAMKI